MTTLAEALEIMERMKEIDRGDGLETCDHDKVIAALRSLPEFLGDDESAPRCRACRGSGAEGTGTPSAEGGEDWRECASCGGSGEEPLCPYCGGTKSGRRYCRNEWHDPSITDDAERCDWCLGSGHEQNVAPSVLKDRPCHKCAGKGRIP